MADKISAFVASYLDSWQHKLSEVLQCRADLSLTHEGLNHLIFVVNNRWILRLPGAARSIISSHNPPPTDIAHRINLFARTGYCPSVHHVFNAEELPPAGGLLTSYVVGRSVELPADLPLLADCLAALHTSPSGDHAIRPNITAVIHQRLPSLTQAPIAQPSRDLIYSLIEQLPATDPLPSATDEPVLADSHPGNFIMTRQKAMVIDVEGDFIHSPAIDLAHITSFASLLWWQPSIEPLNPADIASFYHHYLSQRGIMDRYKSFISIRPLIICRTLSWMFYLLNLAQSGSIAVPQGILLKASNILTEDNLEKLIINETELKKLC